MSRRCIVALGALGVVGFALAGCGPGATGGGATHAGATEGAGADGEGAARARCDEPCAAEDCAADDRAADGCDDTEHAGDPVDPDDPSLEIDPQVCQVDSDCLVGTPRDCCTSFCPEHAVAWSHEAWLRYQEECAVEECAVVENLACQPDEGGPPRTARCVAERCVLR